MRKDLADIVCCPVHKTRLQLRVTKEEQGDIVSGILHCGDCPFDYPIEDSIPNLLPPEYHVDQVKEGKSGATPAAPPGEARRGLDAGESKQPRPARDGQAGQARHPGRKQGRA